jgi:alcohol dehydrogenase
MHYFTLHLPTTLYFGPGVCKKTGRILRAHGVERVLLLTGQGSCRTSGALDTVTGSLNTYGLAWREYSGIPPSPTTVHATEAVLAAREFQAWGLLPIGGGSVIDTAKAAAAALDAGLDSPLPLMEQGREITRAYPVFAVSTLAGSGSEMNGDCLLRIPGLNRKRGLRGPALFPRASFVDPAWQHALPWQLTLQGGLDAFAHVLERYLCHPLRPAPDMLLELAEALLRGLLQQLHALHRDSEDPAARSALCWGALMAQNNALLAGLGPGDWSLHVLAHALEVHCPETHCPDANYPVADYPDADYPDAHAPHPSHGACIAALLPDWLEHVQRLGPAHARRVERLARNVLHVPGLESPGLDAPEHSAGSALRGLMHHWQGRCSLSNLGFDLSLLPAVKALALEEWLHHGGDPEDRSGCWGAVLSFSPSAAV